MEEIQHFDNGELAAISPVVKQGNSRAIYQVQNTVRLCNKTPSYLLLMWGRCETKCTRSSRSSLSVCMGITVQSHRARPYVYLHTQHCRMELSDAWRHKHTNNRAHGLCSVFCCSCGVWTSGNKANWLSIAWGNGGSNLERNDDREAGETTDEGVENNGSY